jgi:ribosome-binding factor A
MQKYSDEGKVRRHHRVTELLREEISAVLNREVKDPRVKFVTVTEVQLKPDLKSAVIMVTKFMAGKGVLEEPSQEEQDELMEGLQASSRYIYEQLKRRLVMKVIPSIRFQYDTRLAESSRIWDLVRRANEDGGRS